MEYMIASFPFFKKIIMRRVTYGSGISVSGLKQWFKLDAEQSYIETKARLERQIEAELVTVLD